ncbi:MAG: hypothetical protein CFE21_09470 [Bacteroidetes bacterium B1(2017)]|nr:MAG: hypothetical protein CFE21_09470 [Bacteroidetes bacterium B1(2017)]
MEPITKMKKILAFCSLFLFVGSRLIAQMPNPALVGYWHNWSDVNAPYIQLDSIDARYNVIEVAFAVPTSTSNMTMVFTPDVVSQSVFIAKVQALKLQGRKVLISIGGATSSIDLTTTTNKNAFISSMTSIINTYGFDGIDLDIENGNSILITGGTIALPTNTAQINLIDAVKQIMANYRATHPQKLLLTITPETAYVQGGMSGFGSIWGGYLPLINALRDSLDILQVQLYNSGSMNGIDNKSYIQGTADFVLALTDAVIHGFTTTGGTFAGLPASKVAVGLPACSSAAGGGFVDSSTLISAMNYLIGKGPKPSTYVLSQTGGYPTLRGMMTWSVNWDAVSTCANKYQFANTYQSVFGSTLNVQVPKYVATNGLVAWWPFTGNASDSSGYGLNGVVSGATLATDRFGNPNKAYSFNGTTSKITASPSALLNLLHNRTVSVWVKSTDSTSDAGIVGNLSNGHTGYQILLRSSGKLASMEDNWTGGANTPPTNGWDFANSTTSTYLNDKTWHHVVSVRSNDSTRLYIDGVLQTTSFTTLVPSFTSSSIIIGSTTGASQFFKGIIDEIGIWNRALTPQEIASLNYGCPYTITSQPSNQNAVIGDTKSFTLVHSGSGINYQWQTNPLTCGWQNLQNGTPYSGAQSPVLAVSGISYPNHNQSFRVISSYGECADTSNTVKLILSTIANDSAHLAQLKNDSIAKAATINSLLSDTTSKGITIRALINDTTSKSAIINAFISDTTSRGISIRTLISDTSNKAKTISDLRSDTTSKGITINTLLSDTSSKSKTISDLRSDTTSKGMLISVLISDTSNKGKTIVTLIGDTIFKAKLISDLRSDTTSKGIRIRQLEADLANKHDTVYVASVLTNDTLKISIHTGIAPTSPRINSLKVYPNPASSYLIIELENPGYFVAKLTGLSGQTAVYQKNTSIDISGLANGVYILSIFDSENKLLSTNKVAIIR